MNKFPSLSYFYYTLNNQNTMYLLLLDLIKVQPVKLLSDRFVIIFSKCLFILVHGPDDFLFRSDVTFLDYIVRTSIMCNMLVLRVRLL